MVTVMENKGPGLLPATIRVAVRILDDRERRHLSQIIAVTGQRTGWTLLSTPCAEADLVFVNPEDPGSQLLLDRSREGRRPLTVSYGGEEATDINLPKPARSSELYQLLQELQERLSKPEEASDNEQHQPSQRLVQTEDYGELIRLLASIKDRPLPVHIKIDEHNSLLIDPRRGVVYLLGKALQEDLDGCLERLKTLPKGATAQVPLREFTQMLVNSPSAGIAMEELAWLVCHKAIPSRKQPRSVIEQPFRLGRWPNFSRLPHKQVHLLWSGSLMRESMNLQQLTARSSGGMVAAARFYNSCLVSGLIKHDIKQREATQGSKHPHGRSGVFKRIIDKLAG